MPKFRRHVIGVQTIVQVVDGDGKLVGTTGNIGRTIAVDVCSSELDTMIDNLMGEVAEDMSSFAKDQVRISKEIKLIRDGEK